VTGAQELEAITGFCLVTGDLARLAGFYADALGFTLHGAAAPISPGDMALLALSGDGKRQVLSLGEQVLFIEEYERKGRDYPTDGNSASLWFQHLAIVVDDMAKAYARLLDMRPISRGGPRQLPDSSGGVKAFKFRDPDGHPLELLEFPAGRMPVFWQGRRGLGRQVGLGIDHSAISVADAAVSAAFYETLGLSRLDGSLNTGPAQQNLDGLRNVRVQVVPMKPHGTTPHLELLCYRFPKSSAAATSHANDVAATRVLWRGRKAALLRDPDGHLHQITT
jgi:catechol 2,3-dioxygenase-like lactoylglutathione lyase family enzyme